jgi:hypothetical protein
VMGIYERYINIIIMVIVVLFSVRNEFNSKYPNQ